MHKVSAEIWLSSIIYELPIISYRLHPNQEAPSKALPMLVGVRNIDGHQCRIATVEVLADI